MILASTTSAGIGVAVMVIVVVAVIFGGGLWLDYKTGDWSLASRQDREKYEKEAAVRRRMNQNEE